MKNFSLAFDCFLFYFNFAIFFDGMNNPVLKKEALFNELIALSHRFLPSVIDQIREKRFKIKEISDIFELQEFVQVHISSFYKNSYEYDSISSYFNKIFEKIFLIYSPCNIKEKNQIYNKIQSDQIETDECKKNSTQQIDFMKKFVNDSMQTIKEMQENELEQIIENTTNRQSTKKHKIEQREFLDLSSVIDSQNLTISRLIQRSFD